MIFHQRWIKFQFEWIEEQTPKISNFLPVGITLKISAQICLKNKTFSPLQNVATSIKGKRLVSLLGFTAESPASAVFYGHYGVVAIWQASLWGTGSWSVAGHLLSGEGSSWQSWRGQITHSRTHKTQIGFLYFNTAQKFAVSTQSEKSEWFETVFLEESAKEKRVRISGNDCTILLKWESLLSWGSAWK